MSEHIKSARKPRPGEVIGGGAFVFRRGQKTGRIRPSQFPHEHQTIQVAKAEADRLAKLNPGFRFDVLAVISSSIVEPTK